MTRASSVGVGSHRWGGAAATDRLPMNRARLCSVPKGRPKAAVGSSDPEPHRLRSLSFPLFESALNSLYLAYLVLVNPLASAANTA